MEQKVNKLLDLSIDNELVFVERVFQQTKNFSGAVGFTMRPLYQSEIDENEVVDPQDYRELWVQAVVDNRTDESLDDYIERISSCYDGYFYSDDPSYRIEAQQILATTPTNICKFIGKHFHMSNDVFVDWMCQSCGRCISTDEKDYTMIFDFDLFELVCKYEKNSNK